MYGLLPSGYADVMVVLFQFLTLLFQLFKKIFSFLLFLYFLLLDNSMVYLGLECTGFLWIGS